MLGRPATRRGLGIKNHVRDAGDGVATPCTSISTHTRIGDSHMSRNARRIALSLGTAAGAALIAAAISMGNAPAARADITDAEPVSDLIGAFDPSAFDSPSGAPTDPLGLLGYYTDTYLLGPSGLGDALDPSVDSYVSSLPSGAASVLDADPVSDLI